MEAINNISINSYQPNFTKKSKAEKGEEVVSKKSGMKKSTKVMLGMTALAVIVAGGLLCKKSNAIKEAGENLVSKSLELVTGKSGRGRIDYKQLKGLGAEIYPMEQGKTVKGLDDPKVKPLLDKVIESFGQTESCADKAYVIRPSKKSNNHLSGNLSDLHVGLMNSKGEVFIRAFFKEGEFVKAVKPSVPGKSKCEFYSEL